MLLKGLHITCTHINFYPEQAESGLDLIEQRNCSPRTFLNDSSFKTHSPFVLDALDGRRPFSMPSWMAAELSRTGTELPHKTQCQTNGEHIIFICLLASELENLWSAMSNFIHNGIHQVSNLNTLYVHAEFYKRGMRLDADARIIVRGYC